MVQVPNEIETAKSIMQWFGTFGITEHFMSDSGSHYTSKMIKKLESLLKINHYFSAGGAHWSNGTIERMNKEVQGTFKALCSEYSVDWEDWPEIIELVEFTLNHTWRRRLTTSPAMLQGCADYVGPSQFVLRVNDRVQIVSSPTDQLEELRTLLEHHTERARHQMDLRRMYEASRKDNGPLIHFNPGDIILAVLFVDGDKKGHKLRPTWQGPMEVVSVKGRYLVTVRDSVTGFNYSRHCAFVRHYDDQAFAFTAPLKELIARHRGRLQIDRLSGLGFDDAGDLTVEVFWESLNNMSSWEDLFIINLDAPDLVSTLLDSLTDDSRAEALAYLAARSP